MREHSVRVLYVKELAPNDNSKNQPYFGGDFTALNILPVAPPEPESGVVRPNFKARLNFAWLTDSGRLSPAPHAKLILYPDYPEVRFSGYLKGSPEGPSALMGTTREAGRLLFLGVTDNGLILGHAAGSDSELRREYDDLRGLEEHGVFRRIPLEPGASAADDERALLSELCRVHRAGWIDAKSLLRDGRVIPCGGEPRCIGHTLEAELGIVPNGISAPDFRGWEVKSFSVRGFRRPSGGAITLMTPEPTGGLYREDGVIAFVDAYGYQSGKPGRENRRDFGGRHYAWHEHVSTRLTLSLTGFDRSKKSIIDPTGSIALVDAKDRVAAEWGYADLMAHWNRKHANAAYVPAMKETEGGVRYYYGPVVRLGRGTEFLRFLRAVDAGSIYYDPGIYYDRIGQRTRTKRRSQFRIASGKLTALYESMESVNVCGGVPAS